MKRSALVTIISVFIFFTTCLVSAADERPVLGGTVSDVSGKEIEGASVFVYTGPDIRRPADFISGRTGKDGRFSLFLPPGKYWVVARLKKAEGYGPLMPGDKHSGEPRLIEIALGQKNAGSDFIVADIMEAALIKSKTVNDFVKVRGRILDEKGVPVKTGYVIANRKEKKTDMPDYLSAWTDDEGRYIMYLPRGKYYIAAASQFPPGEGTAAGKSVVFDADRADVDVTLRTGK